METNSVGIATKCTRETTVNTGTGLEVREKLHEQEKNPRFKASPV